MAKERRFIRLHQSPPLSRISSSKEIIVNFISSFYKKPTRALLAVMLSMGAISSAQALPIQLSAGQTQNFSFGDIYNNFNLLTTGSITVGTITPDLVDVTFTVNNLSTRKDGSATTAADNVRLVAFGFGINPNVKSVSFTDLAAGGMIKAMLGNIPSIKDIEVCAFSGPNCSGGAFGGLDASGTDTFKLTLTSDVIKFGNSIQFDPLGVKYQTGPGSFEISCSGVAGCVPTSVPEPASIALLGLGLAAFSLSRKRK